MIADIFSGFLDILTNYRPQYLLPVCVGLTATFVLIYKLGGRAWAFLYVILIPFLNWSFGVVPNLQIVPEWAIIPAAQDTSPSDILLHPLAVVTGLVFVIRDFVQREMKHLVLVVMVIAIGWSIYYAWIVIAIASGLAFAISEFFDWLIFTFTKYRLSTRIVLSSAVAAPIDTTVFLYGADLAKQMEYGLEAGNTFHLANWTVFIIAKMIGAVIVSRIIRNREDAGKINPHEFEDIPDAKTLS
ncbi:MAG: hypothetical protein L3J02_05180 [Henriciella sp.]|nr:hypothetical protein [Henriciella sp.]